MTIGTGLTDLDNAARLYDQSQVDGHLFGPSQLGAADKLIGPTSEPGVIYKQITGKTIPVAGGVDMTFREPLGVVGLITPWNFPLWQAVWKLAPALAAGNTVVVKPAENTPLSTTRFAQLAAEALPAGALNVVHGRGRVAGVGLVGHPDVAMVSFTGSTVAGQAIAKLAAETPKRVVL